MQQPGLEDATYLADQNSSSVGAPVAPKFGDYGTVKEDDLRVEETKRDLLRKSLAKQNGETNIRVRAGGGSPTQSVR